MDNNIDLTIKVIATIFLILGIIGSAVAGFILLSNEKTIGLGVALISGGPLTSIIGYCLLYGYGELIERVCIICHNKLTSICFV